MTGLPNPQEDHATIMARFACQIIHEFDIVVADLKDALGSDTAELRLRVGCHSGPVTAGVLRGGKHVPVNTSTYCFAANLNIPKYFFCLII